MSDRALATAQKQTTPATPSVTGFLQRKCACGNHTVAGAECQECGRKKNSLQREAINQDANSANFSLSDTPVMQRKLTMGSSKDPLEGEADRIADQVLAIPPNSGVAAVPPRIQRFARHPTGQTAFAPASVDRVLASSGSPLDPALRRDMEQRFLRDFSQVRVHSGAAAEQSAREVDAHAYTAGQSIVFGAGRFSPASHEGRRLLAHELTHVVQQFGTAEIRRGARQDYLSPFSLLGSSGDALTLQREDKGPPVLPGIALPQKIIPGSTSLSRQVQAYRIDHPNLPEATNLVGVEYGIPGTDRLQTRVFENRPQVAHSEEVMDQFFRDLRRETRKEVKVLKIYSERQFCGPAEHDCEGLLLKSDRYKSAEKTFGYDYQDAASRVPGEGPYRAGQTRGKVQESHERLAETKNTEWDFQKKPTQPYHERLGQPKGGAPAKPPTVTPSGVTDPGVKAQAKVVVEGLGKNLKLMRAARVLNGVVRIVEFAGNLVMIYQSLSMAKNAQAGEGFVLTDKIKEAEDLRDQANALNAEYPAFSDWVHSLGFSLYFAGFDPDCIEPLLADISDLGSEISSQKIDIGKQSRRVKTALKEVTVKLKVAEEIRDDPVKLAAIDHGGGTINAATIFAAARDLSRIQSALMQTDQAWDTLISTMGSDVEFLVEWANWLENVGITSGKLKPTQTVTTSKGELEELRNAPEPEDVGSIDNPPRVNLEE